MTTSRLLFSLNPEKCVIFTIVVCTAICIVLNDNNKIAKSMLIDCCQTNIIENKCRILERRICIDYQSSGEKGFIHIFHLPVGFYQEKNRVHFPHIKIMRKQVTVK